MRRWAVIYVCITIIESSESFSSLHKSIGLSAWRKSHGPDLTASHANRKLNFNIKVRFPRQCKSTWKACLHYITAGTGDDGTAENDSASESDADLDRFMIWARSRGISFDKLELRRLDSAGRGCFATQEILPGEVFLRVPEEIFNYFSTHNSPLLPTLLDLDLSRIGINNQVC